MFTQYQYKIHDGIQKPINLLSMDNGLLLIEALVDYKENNCNLNIRNNGYLTQIIKYVDSII